ncbi:unnamed protein product, partial [Polarella glacialis]
ELFAASPGGRCRRMWPMDLCSEEASFLLLYASDAGDTEDALEQSKAGFSPGPTLVGTASTAAPPSSSHSRQPSDSTLPLVPQESSDSHVIGRGNDFVPPDSPRKISFADLELGECFSRGESTIVHRGTLNQRTSCNRPVVVKALLHEASLNPQAADDLQAEINLLSQLSHPRIVAFLGACMEPGAPLALVTELAAGGNLHHAIHVRRREYSRDQRFQLAQELLEGARYLHAQQPPIAHLDLKSMNLILDAEGQHLRLCDFGLARVLGDAAVFTNDLESLQGSCSSGGSSPSRGGSPRYMAPECYDESLGSLSEKTDVWSSGCILIEIFGSCQPYAECSSVTQILK